MSQPQIHRRAQRVCSLDLEIENVLTVDIVCIVVIDTTDPAIRAVGTDFIIHNMYAEGS